jgi:hypothetical protein
MMACDLHAGDAHCTMGADQAAYCAHIVEASHYGQHVVLHHGMRVTRLSSLALLSS